MFKVETFKKKWSPLDSVPEAQGLTLCDQSLAKDVNKASVSSRGVYFCFSFYNDTSTF